MVATSSDTEKAVLLRALQAVKPYIKYLDRPVFSNRDYLRDEPKRAVTLGDNYWRANREELLLDRDLNFYICRWNSAGTTLGDPSDIETVLAKYGFARVFRWLRNLTTKRIGELHSRAESMNQGRIELDHILATSTLAEQYSQIILNPTHEDIVGFFEDTSERGPGGMKERGNTKPATAVLLSDPAYRLEAIGQQICVAGGIFSWDTIRDIKYLSVRVSVWCPRHQDGHCDGKVEIERPLRVGNQVDDIDTEKIFSISIGEVKFRLIEEIICSGEACGMVFHIPPRARKELIALTAEYLVAQGFDYIVQ